MSYSEIPLICAPDSYQSFKLTLRSDDGKKNNVSLELRLRYLDRYDIWLADLTKLATSEVLAAGVPLVLGTDILGQMGYFGVGEAYIIQELPTELQHPDNKTLGSTFVLVWGDGDE
jgi:hypothetical protein